MASWICKLSTKCDWRFSRRVETLPTAEASVHLAIMADKVSWSSVDDGSQEVSASGIGAQRVY